GGLCKATYPDTAKSISKTVVGVYKENNAEEIITACPACFDNLINGIEDLKNIDIKDIHSLIIDLLK
ncbi:MAG: hypothetical protein ACFFD2_26900, partial [Promethearchaeota archaeon]